MKNRRLKYEPRNKYYPQNLDNFTFKYFFEHIENVKDFEIYGKISNYDSLLDLQSINIHFNTGGDCYIMRSDYDDYQNYSAFDYLNDDNVFNIKNIAHIAKQWESLNYIAFRIGSNDIVPLHANQNFLDFVNCISQCLNGYIEVIEYIPNIPSGLYDIAKWLELREKLKE